MAVLANLIGIHLITYTYITLNLHMLYVNNVTCHLNIAGEKKRNERV